MKEQTALQLATKADDETRLFVAAAWPLEPLAEPRVKRWRIAGRMTLLGVLGFSALQYYFFDVWLTIMSMPRVAWIAGLS